MDKALEIANAYDSLYRNVLLAASGIVFLASPHQGSRAATAAHWQTMLAGILNKAPSQTLLQDLDGQTGALRETTRRFIEIIRKPQMKMMTHCFWETRPTQILNKILPKSVASLSTVTKAVV